MGGASVGGGHKNRALAHGYSFSTPFGVAVGTGRAESVRHGGDRALRAPTHQASRFAGCPTFGSEKAIRADSTEITEPSGQRDAFRSLKANATYNIQSSGEILAPRALKAAPYRPNTDATAINTKSHVIETCDLRDQFLRKCAGAGLSE